MNHRIHFFFALLLFKLVPVNAQVQVSKEPSHHLVLQNQYIRLLDVRLMPGDTTQYHIHSTPSLFLQLTHTKIGIQIKGGEWTTEQSLPGNTSYRSFSPDSIVHRVANFDTVLFHVNDIELLSPFQKTGPARKRLPFTVLFENEKAIAYAINNESMVQKVGESHGPLVAELVSGPAVVYHDLKSKKPVTIVAGQYLYIEPGIPFNFSTDASAEISMILFEIK